MKSHFAETLQDITHDKKRPISSPESYNLGQNSWEKFLLKHHLARTHKIYWSFPPSPHTNVDNVMQNTVQAFGRFLKQHWNEGRGESRKN